MAGNEYLPAKCGSKNKGNWQIGMTNNKYCQYEVNQKMMRLKSIGTS